MAADGMDSFDEKREVIFIIDTLAYDTSAGTDGITENIFSGCGYVTVANFVQNCTVVGGNQILVIVNLFREGCHIKELLDYFKFFVDSEWYAGGAWSKGSELVSEDTFRGRNGYGHRRIVGKKQFVFDLTGLCGKVWTVCKDDIQKDIEVIIPQR